MKTLLLPAVLSLLCGCAQLQVRVELLSQDYLASAAHADGLRKTARLILSADRTEADRFIAEGRGQYYSILGQCAEEYQAQVRNLRVPPDDEALLALQQIAQTLSRNAQQPNSQVESLFNAWSDELRRADEAAQKVLRADSTAIGLYWQRNPERAADELSAPAVEAVLARNLRYGEVRDEIQKALAAAVANCDSGVRGFANVVQLSPGERLAIEQAMKDVGQQAGIEAERAVAEAAGRTIRGDAQALLDRAEAYHVANAPEAAWSDVFNIARGEGQGGGVDIGIKMTGTGDFSVKGFTFDARSTSDMVRKVAVQSVALVAGAYGVPVMLDPAGSDPARPASVSFDPDGAIAKDQVKLEEIRQAALAHQTALLNVSGEILSNLPALTAGQPEALEKLRTVVSINKRIATLTPGAPD